MSYAEETVQLKLVN